MKGFTTLVAALAALALAGTASAQTVIHITGSTAYRGQVYAAIAHLMGASQVTAPYTLTTGVYGYVGAGANVAGAGQAIFVGTISGITGQVIIKTSFSGSVGGVHTVSAGNITVNYLPSTPTETLTASGVSGLTDTLVSEIPEVAMSDTFQSSTPFTSTLLQEATVGPVGVVPFKWVANNGAPAGLTNITPQLAQALYGNGSAALSLFTGINADESKTVFAIGRDPDSGTRLTAFAETGLGTNATVVQYHATITGTDVTSQALEAATTINGIAVAQGNGGYSSGGTLAGVMRNTTTGINGTYVTYLSTGDAGTAIAGTGTGAGPGKELTYNGVSYSLANVQEGLYTFWGYEHLLFRSDLVSGKQDIANVIASQIHDVDAAVLIGTMHVSRQTDGGLVTQDF